MKSYIVVAVVLAAGLVSACADDLPTASGPSLVPGSARSVELFLPYGDFAGDLRVFGGYGSPSGLPYDVAADDYLGVLDARVLARFGGFPTVIIAEDREGVSRNDFDFTVIGGRVVAFIEPDEIVEDELSFRVSSLTVPWHPTSATWDFAVDSAGERTPWPEPGGGPANVAGSGDWVRSAGVDSVEMVVDSATVAGWMDEDDDARGARIEVADAGARVRIRDVRLRLLVRPSFNLGDTVTAPADLTLTTTIYSPEPDPPGSGLRIGGAPGWRSFLDFALPPTLNGPPELCDVLGCPLELGPELVTYAGLSLVSAGPPAAFAFPDTLALEIRPVLRPELVPRSPLDDEVAGIESGGVLPGAFTGGGGEVVEVPITGYIRRLLGEGGEQAAVSSTVALLSVRLTIQRTPREPFSFGLGAFSGPGSGDPPRLRLILTRSDEVEFP